MLFVLISGCATPYQSRDITGGFEEYFINEGVYKVSFRGNAYTAIEKAINFTLLRSAELTLEKGYNYFLILDEESYFKETKTKMPDRISVNSRVRETPDRIRLRVTVKHFPGQEISIHKPRSSNTIMMFQYPPSDDDYYDARFVTRTLKRQYDLFGS